MLPWWTRQFSRFFAQNHLKVLKNKVGKLKFRKRLKTNHSPTTGPSERRKLTTPSENCIAEDLFDEVVGEDGGVTGLPDDDIALRSDKFHGYLVQYVFSIITITHRMEGSQEMGWYFINSLAKKQLKRKKLSVCKRSQFQPEIVRNKLQQKLIFVPVS